MVKWPWKKDYIEGEVKGVEPEEYMSDEEWEEYMDRLRRRTEAWRPSRTGGFERRRASTSMFEQEAPKYEEVFGESEYRGVYKDFLEEYAMAASDEEKQAVYAKHLRKMMFGKGWEKEHAVKRLLAALISHGLA